MLSLCIANIEDADAIAGIYAPYVLNNHVSFETVPPTNVEMEKRIRETMKVYPWLVCKDDGKGVGYAYACQHKDREGYRWSVDTAVYLKEEFHGKRIGTVLYGALFDILAMQGFINAIAGVALPNDASLRLHESCGFKKIAFYKHVGYKCGRWIDTIWMQKDLNPTDKNPSEPVPFPSLKREDIESILRAKEQIWVS